MEYLLTDLTITLPIAHIEWDEGPVLSCDDVDLTIPNQGDLPIESGDTND